MKSRLLVTISLLGIILGKITVNGTKINRPRGLEFIYPAEKISVSTSTEFLPVTLFLSTLKKYTEYKPMIDEMLALVKSVRDMSGLKDNDPLEGLTRVLDDALLQLGDYERYLNLANDYNDPSITTYETHACNVSFDGDFTEDKVENLRKELRALQMGITLTWTAADLQSPLKGGAALTSYAFNARDLIVNLKETLVEQIIRLDALSRAEIPDDVPAILQNAPCYPPAQDESVKLLECTKVNNGLSCNFEIEIYKAVQDYFKMQPINYQSVELEIADPQSFLVKSINHFELGLLNCTRSNLARLETCKFFPWVNSCAKALSGTDHAQIVKVCNFTMQNPTNTRVSEDGVLIQDPRVTIKIESKFPKARSLENKSPMVIFSQDPIELFLNNDGTRFVPENSEIEFEILYTLLDEKIIIEMVKKAKVTETTIDWISLVTYSLLIIHTSTLPVAFYSCIIICRRRQARLEEQRSILKCRGRKENYYANKQYVRGLRDELSPLRPTSPSFNSPPPY